jgi:hypothetical protein
MRLLIQIIVPRDQWYGSVSRDSGDRSFDRSSRGTAARVLPNAFDISHLTVCT